MWSTFTPYGKPRISNQVSVIYHHVDFVLRTCGTHDQRVRIHVIVHRVIVMSMSFHYFSFVSHGCTYFFFYSQGCTEKHKAGEGQISREPRSRESGHTTFAHYCARPTRVFLRNIFVLGYLRLIIAIYVDLHRASIARLDARAGIVEPPTTSPTVSCRQTRSPCWSESW